jgi:hypothetical protein
MVADPIEAITAVKRKQAASSASPTEMKLKHSDFLYNCNYVIAVMQATQVCMQHQQEIVSIRSKLAEITTKIQADMNIMNQYMTTIQSNAKAPGPEGTSGDNNNAYNGFGPKGNGFCDTSDLSTEGFYYTGTVPSGGELEKASQGFIASFKDLYVCSSDSSSPSGTQVSDLYSMENPLNPSKSFDLTKFWKNIQPGYSRDFNVIADNTAHTKPSLVMQYIYWQAKLNLFQATPDSVTAAGIDFTKVPGMNFQASGDGDPNVQGIMKPLEAMYNGPTRYENEARPYFSTAIRDVIYGNGYGYLYGEDALMAYDYYYAKNPQGKASDGSNLSDRSNKPGADVCSDIYTKMQSTQASLSSASSSQGTNFQQDTSGMTTETNEVQQIISSFMQGQGSLVGNFKSA